METSCCSGITTKFQPTLSFFPPRIRKARATKFGWRNELEATAVCQGNVYYLIEGGHREIVVLFGLRTCTPKLPLLPRNSAIQGPIPGEQKQEPVSVNELLLRGCAIRNTVFVIGHVVFTASDTKIMLNGGDTPSKQNKIEKETNPNVINFCVLSIMCVTAASPTSSNIVNAVVTFRVRCFRTFIYNVFLSSFYFTDHVHVPSLSRTSCRFPNTAPSNL